MGIVGGSLGLSRRRLPKLASPPEAQALDFLAPDLSSSNWEVIRGHPAFPVLKFIIGSVGLLGVTFRIEWTYNKSQS